MNEERAEVLKKIREDLVRIKDQQKAIESIFPAKNELFSMERNKAEIDMLMPDLARHMTVPAEPVPSPQPLVGPVKTWFKRGILRLARPLVGMSLNEQIEWNESAYETIRRLHESLDHLRQEMDILNKKMDALRLQNEDAKRTPKN